MSRVSTHVSTQLDGIRHRNILRYASHPKKVRASVGEHSCPPQRSRKQPSASGSRPERMWFGQGELDERLVGKFESTSDVRGVAVRHCRTGVVSMRKVYGRRPLAAIPKSCKRGLDDAPTWLPDSPSSRAHRHASSSSYFAFSFSASACLRSAAIVFAE